MRSPRRNKLRRQRDTLPVKVHDLSESHALATFGASVGSVRPSPLPEESTRPWRVEDFREACRTANLASVFGADVADVNLHAARLATLFGDVKLAAFYGFQTIAALNFAGQLGTREETIVAVQSVLDATNGVGGMAQLDILSSAVLSTAFQGTSRAHSARLLIEAIEMVVDNFRQHGLAEHRLEAQNRAADDGKTVSDVVPDLLKTVALYELKETWARRGEVSTADLLQDIDRAMSSLLERTSVAPATSRTIAITSYVELAAEASNKILITGGTEYRANALQLLESAILRYPEGPSEKARSAIERSLKFLDMYPSSESQRFVRLWEVTSEQAPPAIGFSPLSISP